MCGSFETAKYLSFLLPLSTFLFNVAFNLTRLTYYILPSTLLVGESNHNHRVKCKENNQLRANDKFFLLNPDFYSSISM